MISLINKILTQWYILKYQYLLRKAKFGKGIRIECKLVISGAGKVHVGDNCVFGPNPWGEEYVTIYTHRKKARVLIGDNVVLRATRFGSHLSIIVNDCAVIENASIYDSDFHNIDATKRDDGFNKGDRQVVIGPGAYVGCEVLCSKGTVLGENVVLLPGSVIGTRTVPENVMVGGNPAKKVSR